MNRLGLKSPGLKGLRLKSPGLKSLGLKSPGFEMSSQSLELKLGVEMFRVEMSSKEISTLGFSIKTFHPWTFQL